ncbi:hydroxymethylglutaryl-CoA reductase (NADPH) [Halovenus salina]|uniref:3-hydroxy-3-methylglutaryl coenzyme A reductase n=1 Tax=Halovenus salina TaxID=1510225 RepID=A0ABD5W2B1_9EURY|nr:hydroxymethylglutaryl-CoA reductase (NADPH) [Halovenus salina]
MTDPATLADQLRTGERRLHELDDADAETAAEARRQFLAAETGADLDAIGDFTFDAGQATDANVENFVGSAQVPMGVAGPVAIDGGAADGEYFLPMATTEGALVASVNRGLSAIDDAGGATARVTDSGMTRAPVFRVAGVAEAETVVEWVDDHAEQLREAAESTTSHGELLAVEPYVVGDNVYLRFAYDTKDAMGMNMATIATREAADLVEAETPAELVAISGNLCNDKKPAAINAVEGRGRTVTADVTLSRELVEETLNTTPEAMVEGNTRKNLVGSAKAGSLGFNAHAANTVAAMFLATGQDEAQVVEGANAITTMDAREDGLYASISLASLEVGTVGGGTKLATQSAGLELLGLAGGGDPAGSNADALAEVIAVGALAGELSLIAAFCSRHLASAHEDLGR